MGAGEWVAGEYQFDGTDPLRSLLPGKLEPLARFPDHGVDVPPAGKRLLTAEVIPKSRAGCWPGGGEQKWPGRPGMAPPRPAIGADRSPHPSKRNCGSNRPARRRDGAEE